MGITYSGNCATTTDEAGRVRTVCADALGRVSSVTENPSVLDYQTNYTQQRGGNIAGVQPKQGTPTSLKRRAMFSSWLGMPLSDRASKQMARTPAAIWDYAPCAAPLAPVPSLVEVGDEQEHGLARVVDQALAIAGSPVDVRAAAELNAEQQIDRILAFLRQIDNLGIESNDVGFQRRQAGEDGAHGRRRKRPSRAVGPDWSSATITFHSRRRCWRAKKWNESGMTTWRSLS